MPSGGDSAASENRELVSHVKAVPAVRQLARNGEDASKPEETVNAWDTLRQKYGTLLQQSQTISWIWYDKLAYVSGTTTLLTFFNAVRATLDIGNMELAGQLSGMKAFVVKAIRVYFSVETIEAAAVPGAGNDVARLINAGILQFTVGNKNYGTWPLHALPAGGGVYSDMAGAGGEATNQFQSYAQNGLPDPRCVYTLEHPLLIEPQINFQTQISWPAAQTLTGNTDITVMLDGSLIRPVQ